LSDGLQKKGIIEAALFLANRAVTLQELASITNSSVEDVEGLVAELSEEMVQRNSAMKIITIENAEKLSGNEVKMELNSEYVQVVAPLSQRIDLSKKAIKILGLIAKKKNLLQSELKHYFRGDIYEHVGELVEKGYLTSQKHKSTRELKPTKLFYERFQGFEPE